MAQGTISEGLAGFLVELRRDGLPEDAVERSASLVLDWLGSTLAGSATAPGRILLEYAESQPPGPASVVARTAGRSPEVSALVNGALSHIVEMDDLDRGSVLHPGAVVIPAALAAAETRGRSGRDFLSAVAAGYEVAIRVGEAVGKTHYERFHNTSTCGVFGAAAASAFLLGLDERQTVWALGNAGTQASGLWEFNAEGAMTKHLHAGRAAANGLLAALLAERGFTGPSRILEGERGFFRATAPGAVPERVLSSLGEAKLKLHGVSLKPHASCRHTHAPIDAALALRPRIEGREILEIEVDTYAATLALCDRPRPETPYDAKFSVQFGVASALLRGAAGLRDFSEEAIRDPAVLDLAARVRARVDPEIERRYPEEWPANVRVRLASGELLEAQTNHPRGDPENPLTQDEIGRKFAMLAAFGGFEREAEAMRSWVSSLRDAALLRLPALK